MGKNRRRPRMKGHSIRTKAVHEKYIGVGVVISESSFWPEVPGSAGLSGLSRIWGPVGANTGSFGFDMPYPTNQSRDRDPPVARTRQRPHRDRHKDYGRCAKPALYPDAPKALAAVAERGLRQLVCRRVRRR